MTLDEEALQLRDRIYEVAPDAMKKLTDNKWTVALLNAKAYFETSEDECDIDSTESIWYYPCLRYADYRDRACMFTMFRAGKSINEIAFYCDGKEPIVQNVLNKRYPVLNSPTSETLRSLNKRVGATVEMPINELTNTYATRLALTVGRGIGDVAAQFNISVADAMCALYGFDKVWDGGRMKQAAVIQEWMVGKSITFISDKLGLKVDYVIETLNNHGYVTAGKMSNINTVNDIIKGRLMMDSLSFPVMHPKMPGTTYKTLAPILDEGDAWLIQEYLMLHGEAEAALYAGCGSYEEVKNIGKLMVVNQSTGYLIPIRR